MCGVSLDGISLDGVNLEGVSLEGHLEEYLVLFVRPETLETLLPGESTSGRPGSFSYKS